ncbi:aldo/keto reductase [Cryobacterium roopkundense]|uniref:Aldo/keto reductase n=1 Tax=Cryobacterium roopkundense TaxID=1001240 RepID=A0A099J8N9_9MICO|nr:aldo/keto reductase [Cryobacterium roopkundense]KGJ74455.1 aldo/keto reductase [Cryobacterium roopkundense]MBB5643433.1 aryl-alcohol dehydrogenase-like predicted oxidoreductase [Cryobacterium roopkundense]
MQYRDFGRTGWKVSEISFGGWQLGGQWGTVDDEESVRTLLHAYAQGINFVDTAELYGAGHSEEVIGESLRRWSGDRIHVATKIQPTVWPSADEGHPLMSGRYPEWHLRKGVELALTRLGVERLDLLQLHGWFSDGVQNLDWLETLNALRVEGKIDKIGVSIRDHRPDEGVEIARLGLVDSIQVIFNLFEQRPTHELFPAGAESGTAFIDRVAFDSGSLSGRWTEDTYATWEEGSVQHQLFRGDRFAETLGRVEALKKLCAPYFPTLAEAAMRYTLSSPHVSTVIAGIRTRDHVDRNVSYSDGVPFPQELSDQLAEHNWPRNYYK